MADCSVLVVDPDPFLRELIADFLADLGCEIEFFDDGYSALDEARLHPPSLVITDILIPRLNGLSLSRLVKTDPALGRTKVLVLSVVTAEERARQSGADAFMQKPIERGALTAAIRSLIQTKSAEKPA